MRTIPFLMSEMSFEEPSFSIFTLNISLVYEELLTFKIGALTCGVTSIQLLVTAVIAFIATVTDREQVLDHKPIYNLFTASLTYLNLFKPL